MERQKSNIIKPPPSPPRGRVRKERNKNKIRDMKYKINNNALQSSPFGGIRGGL
jgi:hypothetical protein